MRSAPGRFGTVRFDSSTFAQDIEKLLTLYRNEGFLDARVSRQEVSPHEDSRTVSLFIELAEGSRTMVGEVRLEGMVRGPSARVHKQLRLRVGAPFRRGLLLRDRRTLQVLYANQGLIDAEIAYQALQDTGHTTTVVYQIREGEPIRVGRIVLEGLDKTHPEVVGQELELGPGEFFNLSKINKSQRNLFRTGLFRTVLVEPGPRDPARPQVRDLVVTLRERPAGSFEAGVGYGTSERLRVGLSASQDNWRGRGMQIGFDSRLSRLVRQAEVAFTARRLAGLGIAADTRLFYDRERNDQALFTTRRMGGDLTFSRRFGGPWRAQVKYLLEWVRLFEVAQREILVPTRSTSSVSLGLTRDTRDDLLDPKQGGFLRGRIDYAGGILQGQNHFVRPTGSVALYRGMGRGLLWAGRVQAQYIRTLDKGRETIEYERFYLGGERSVRGYARHQIGADQVGNVALNFQTEIRFPLGRLSGVVFLDGGRVWRRVGDVALGELRYGYGGGIRYVSSVGLLRLDVGGHRGNRPLHERLEIYLGVGQVF